MTPSEQTEVYEHKITTALRRVANSDEISVDISDEEENQELLDMSLATRIEHLNEKGADYVVATNLQK